jgi:hypothetical protein
MSRAQPPARSLVSRALGRVGIDRHPMRRTIDRVEAWATLVLLATLVLAGPALVWTTGRQVYRQGTAAERVEPSPLYRTDAVLVRDAAALAVDYPIAVVPMIGADARWTAPDGTGRRGQLMVRAGTPAGSTVPLWTDAAGDPATAPPPHAQTVRRTVLAGAGVATGLILLLAAARQVLHRALDRRRLAGWETSWSAVEPRWSGRR